jgi:hypothetical protein
LVAALPDALQPYVVWRGEYALRDLDDSLETGVDIAVPELAPLWFGRRRDGLIYVVRQAKLSSDIAALVIVVWDGGSAWADLGAALVAAQREAKRQQAFLALAAEQNAKAAMREAQDAAMREAQDAAMREAADAAALRQAQRAADAEVAAAARDTAWQRRIDLLHTDSVARALLDSYVLVRDARQAQYAEY